MPHATRTQRASTAAALELVAHAAGLPALEARLSPTRWTAEQRAHTADLAGAVALEAMHAASSFLAAGLAPELSPADRRNLAAAAKESAIVAGILVDKSSLLAGLATSRVERIDADQLRARLATILEVRPTAPAVAELPATPAPSSSSTPTS